MLPTSTAHTASAWLGIYINPKSAILGHVFMFLSYYKIGLQFHLVSVFRFMYIMLSLSPTQQAHTNMYVNANSALLVSWFIVTLGHVSTAASTEAHKSANRIGPLPSCMLHDNSCFMSCYMSCYMTHVNCYILHDSCITCCSFNCQLSIGWVILMTVTDLICRPPMSRWTDCRRRISPMTQPPLSELQKS